MSQLFFSYSHRDEAYRDELEVHLSPLKREGLISTWHDRRISAGDEFGHEISDQLERADAEAMKDARRESPIPSS